MVIGFLFFGALFALASILGFFRGRGVAKRGRSLGWSFYVWPFAGVLVLMFLDSGLTWDAIRGAPLNFLADGFAFFAVASCLLCVPYIGAAIGGFYLTRRKRGERNDRVGSKKQTTE